MTDAPERIWIDNERYEQHWHIGKPPTPDRYAHVLGEYIRADIARPMTVAEAAKVADLRFQDIGDGCRPSMPVDALTRDLEAYSKCMPSAHRAQNIMAQAAKLIRAMSQGGE